MPVGVRHADDLAPAVLEDHRQHAEGGRDGEQVEQDRLDRDHDRPERDQQQHERHHQHEAEHERRVRRQVGVAVHGLRGAAADVDRGAGDGAEGRRGRLPRGACRRRPATRRRSRRRRAAAGRCATVWSRLSSVVVERGDRRRGQRVVLELGDGGLHDRRRDVVRLDDGDRRPPPAPGRPPGCGRTSSAPGRPRAAGRRCRSPWCACRAPGRASATSTATPATRATTGRRSTWPSTKPQTRESRSSRFSRRSSGRRLRCTRSPSFASTAGSTVSEPSTATPTTRIEPTAIAPSRRRP